jgi:hypothetical protein
MVTVCAKWKSPMKRLIPNTGQAGLWQVPPKADDRYVTVESDSNGAYEVARHTADLSHANFAKVDYTLRTDGGEPI